MADGTLVSRTGLNGWYVLAEHPMQVGWLGRLQFIRKYYLNIPTRWVRDAERRVLTSLGILPRSHGR